MTSSRTSVENSKTGDKENGLTRTRQTNGLALALGQHHRFEYTLTNLEEQWDSAVVNREFKDTETKALKLSGGLGQKSQYSIGQSYTSSLTAGKATEDTELRTISLKWNDWRNFTFNGSMASKDNALSGETNEVLDMDLSYAISPRFQLSGKLLDNTTVKSDKTLVENDLLDLKLTSQLSERLSLTNSYRTAANPNDGETASSEHVLTWTVSPRWSLTSHLVDTDITKNAATTDTQVFEHTLTGQIGDKANQQQVNFFTRAETLAGASQQRNEISYVRSLSSSSPTKLLVQAGDYALHRDTAEQGRSLLAIQCLNLQPTDDMSVSFGYYSGPRLGAGYLTYRTWGQRARGNLAAWTPEDFIDYREIGGEVTQKLTADTSVSVKLLQGEIQNSGKQQVTEYGLTRRIGKFSFQGSQIRTAPCGQTAGNVVTLWKLSAPGAAPLPDWAATSSRTAIFQDGASWGFGSAPAWLASKSVSGLSLEKRQTTINGKAEDLYSLQWGKLFGERVFLQASYQENPLKQGNASQSDATTRRMAHLAYRLAPDLQFFGRFTSENWNDQAVTDQRSTSIGILGKLSPVERLQLQFDLQDRRTKGVELTGNAYMLEYERTFTATDSLIVKAFVQPREFVAEKDRIRLDARWTHAF